jgi:cell division protein FtsB
MDTEQVMDITIEGKDQFDALMNGEETTTESSPETVPEAEQPVEGEVPTEELPFHAHPRWKQREAELQELRQSNEETARELAELRASQEETSQRLKPQDSNIPDWFTELYGENDVAWRKYSEHEQKRTEEIEARVFQRQEESRQKQAQETQRWDNWVETQITKLQDTGATFDRNKFVSTMLEYRPTDENNNLDFNAGFKIYQALEGKPDTAKSEARKQLADTTTKTSTRGEPQKKDYKTSQDLRNKSWENLLE